MKNIKPFGPTIGKTKISKNFFDKINKEFNTKSMSKKIDYSGKLASQIKKELKISNNFIKKNLEKELKNNIKIFLSNEKIKNIKEIKILNLMGNDDNLKVNIIQYITMRVIYQELVI